MVHILIVEDEHAISDLLKMNLSRAGYECTCAYDGLAAADILENRNFDLVILDIMLPHINGYELMEYIRPMGIPVIFLTAKASLDDKMKGLTSGAEDYIVKPFEVVELLARVKSQLRRYLELNPGVLADSNTIEVQDVVIDTKKHRVTVDGRDVVLTPIEFSILQLLASHPGRVFSTDEIYENVWNEKLYEANNTVMVHMRRLREKVEKSPRSPQLIKTVWGVGYKIEG